METEKRLSKLENIANEQKKQIKELQKELAKVKHIVSVLEYEHNMQFD
jgi:uncharacterized coiled-coil protein SlyX